MDAYFIVLAALLILFTPAIAIAALVVAIQAHSRLRELRYRLDLADEHKAGSGDKQPASSQKAERERSHGERKEAKSAAAPQPQPQTPPQTGRREVPPPIPSRRTFSMEEALGGKAAAIVGIAVLVLGIVFLVVYAIQNAWLGPGARIMLGLISGGLLVALGHAAERRSDRLPYLARVLTGGGASLFYFCVYAAFGVYHLIGRTLCGAGLLLSALAVLGLAWAYSSQLVALLGVVGAFLTPLLAGKGMGPSAFTLTYVALVNLPVLGLALKRRWQSLYNVAFAATAFYLLGTLDWMTAPANWQLGILFALICFAEFAGLGLLKLRGEERPFGRVLDIGRLALNSLVFMGLLYLIMEESGHGAWTGTAFLTAAVLHMLLARASWKWLPAFRHETLTLLIGGLSFASLALPVQLDGAWVCVGWSIEGLILAWFALRAGSRTLQAGAMLLGLIGIGKALLYDIVLYETPPELFLNARFGAGAVSALLLAAQSFLYARMPAEDSKRKASMEKPLLTSAVLGMIVIMIADAFWTIGANEPEAWLLTTAGLLAAGTVTVMLAAHRAPCRRLAVFLLFVIPAKILLLDLPVCYLALLPREHTLFLSMFFWLQLLILAGLLLINRWLLAEGKAEFWSGKRGTGLNLMAQASGILLVSFEFGRVREAWADTSITLWWSLCALALVGWGFVRKHGTYRYAGLFLFGITAFKIFFIDLAGLTGLSRIAALIGAGILLLLLSLLYQQLSSRLLETGSETEREGEEVGS